VDESGFGILELLCDVTREPEVRILIDGAGNETWDVGDLSKDVRE